MNQDTAEVAFPCTRCGQPCSFPADIVAKYGIREPYHPDCWDLADQERA